MSESIIGRKILRFAQVESTNTLLREYAEQDEPEGLVIFAGEQTAGRGRLGRKWIVPPDTSLQFSVLLRPPLAPSQATRLTPMAALALVRTLETEYHLAPTLKWPNDVLLRGKKVSGILTESGIQGDSLAYVILGIGLNVNYSMRSFPDLAPYATTLQDELGRSVELTPLEHTLLHQLDSYYARIRRGESLLDEYRTRLTILGQSIRVSDGSTIIEGIAQDVIEDGALLLRQGSSLRTLYAGDVTVLKPNKETI